MKLDRIKSLVTGHSGVFHCVGTGGKDELLKNFRFVHKYNDPLRNAQVPNTGMLREFYNTFGNLTLYFNEDSGDAAFYILKILEPGSEMLTHMAAHMSFAENDTMHQWWIKEMRDNKGRVVRTEE